MKITKYISLLVLGLFLYFFGIKPMVINPLLLNANYAFIGGKIILKKASVNGDMDYVYQYKVNQKIYTGLCGPQLGSRLNIGDCYLVKYYPPNPQIGKMDLDKPTNCN